MTFETVKGLDGQSDTVSFKSVSKPGCFLAVTADGVKITDGEDASKCSFTIE